MPNIKRIRWVDDEVVNKNIVDFVRNRFYNNSDIKMFLLKYITNEDRKYKLFINDKNNIIIDHSIKHFKPNKQIIKRIKGFIINIKGNTIYLNKVTILRILKQSKIKENKIINTITYFTKHLKQNYEILIKYHKEFYPNKLKKKLSWIKNKDEISVKIKNKNISKFEDLIIKAEEYYNMVIEDENRRLREVGLLFPIKRSRSGDLRSNDIMKKIREKNEVNSKNSLDSTDNDTDINQYKKNENKDFNAISKHNEKEKKNDGSNLSGSKLRKNKINQNFKIKDDKRSEKDKKEYYKKFRRDIKSEKVIPEYNNIIKEITKESDEEFEENEVVKEKKEEEEEEENENENENNVEYKKKIPAKEIKDILRIKKSIKENIKEDDQNYNKNIINIKILLIKNKIIMT